MSAPLAHWDEVPAKQRGADYIRAEWTFLGAAAGSVGVGVNRLRMEPGQSPNPPHRHGAEEEIFYVLSGSGLSWHDGETFEIGPGDCIVHVANRSAHTLQGGPEGLEVLAFGPRLLVELCVLPGSHVSWLGPGWVTTGGPNPWAAALAAGPPEFPPPSPRPANIVNLADVEPETVQRTTVAATERGIGEAAGSVTTGLFHQHVPAGMLNCPPHCHSAEEELFVVLAGEGSLLLGDDEIALRPGHVVARPAATGVAHAFRGAGDGLELLAYGTREPNDICYYPRSGKISLRGVGVIGRIEPLDYWDGEE